MFALMAERLAQERQQRGRGETRGRDLRTVYADRAIFAGMVDAQDPLDRAAIASLDRGQAQLARRR